MEKKEVISEIEILFEKTVLVYVSASALARMNKAKLLLALEKLQLLLIAQDRYTKLVEGCELTAHDLLRIALDGADNLQEEEVITWRCLVQGYASDIEGLS